MSADPKTFHFRGTPGPWLRDDSTVYAVNEEGVNSFAATVYSKSKLEEFANAVAIAAVPDMLATLQNVHAILSDNLTRQRLSAGLNSIEKHGLEITLREVEATLQKATEGEKK